jgi:hypothetical protein
MMLILQLIHGLHSDMYSFICIVNVSFTVSCDYPYSIIQDSLAHFFVYFSFYDSFTDSTSRVKKHTLNVLQLLLRDCPPVNQELPHDRKEEKYSY